MRNLRRGKDGRVRREYFNEGNRKRELYKRQNEQKDLRNEIGETLEGQDETVKAGKKGNQDNTQKQTTNQKAGSDNGGQIQEKKIKRKSDRGEKKNRRQECDASDPVAAVNTLTDVTISPECKVDTCAHTNTQPGGEIWL